jgi:CBS domain-containing protein
MRAVAAVKPETGLAQAAQVMIGFGVDCLPVVDNGRPVGVVGCRDIPSHQ